MLSASSVTRLLVIGAILTTLVTASFYVGAHVGSQRAEERLIAVAWGDGKYGPAFYGAYVYLVPDAAAFRVYARVRLGRGNGLFHDCGEIGRARDEAEAVARFGRVSWTAAGLEIGSGQGSYALARAVLDRHR